MGLEVIGAGFGRTGTMSLKLALEQLGFDRCYHMMEVVQNPNHLPSWQQAMQGGDVDWDTLFHGYRATVDWPACSFWQVLLDHYPNARVILSLRDAEGWYRSVSSTIYPSSLEGLASEDPVRLRHAQWVNALIWQGTFDGRIEDETYAKSVFERHNADVKASVPARQLLVYQPGDGWEPLCEFLGVPVPDTDFPKVNSTEDFRVRWQRIRGGEAKSR